MSEACGATLGIHSKLNLINLCLPQSPGLEVVKLFSCSTQLSMEFQMLIKYKMLKNNDFSCFQMLRCCIYHAHKY